MGSTPLVGHPGGIVLQKYFNFGVFGFPPVPECTDHRCVVKRSSRHSDKVKFGVRFPAYLLLRGSSSGLGRRSFKPDGAGSNPVPRTLASVLELVDKRVSKTRGRKLVWVRVPPEVL